MSSKSAAVDRGELPEIEDVDVTEVIRPSYRIFLIAANGRAIPDVRDGLKPVHRRILWTAFKLGVLSDVKTVKCARVVGECMGKYHPHGDLSIYHSMVGMAQPWGMRYPLVIGQGNFGSIEGDPPGAQRYTEMKLSKVAEFMLGMSRPFEINKNTVNLIPNYDNSEKEPEVMPSRIPNLLANGSYGIGVALSTSVLPHNLGELFDAAIAIVDDDIAHKGKHTLQPMDMLKYVKGPDFPLGGVVVGEDGFKDVLTTGKGRIVVRGRMHMEEADNGGQLIVIDEIPYGVSRSALVQDITKKVNEKKLEGITDLRNESAETTRVVLELAKTATAKVVANNLFRLTALESAQSVNQMVFYKNYPRVMNTLEILTAYVEHQEEVVRRRTQFDLDAAERRHEILSGYVIGIDNAEQIIARIRKSADNDDARGMLMKTYKLSEVQANAILEMNVRRFSRMELQRIKDEIKELVSKITYYKSLLNSRAKLLEVVKEEMLEIRKQVADPRRTEIDKVGKSSADLATVEDLIPNVKGWLVLISSGYIKRQPESLYRTQRRGGKGVAGASLKESDSIQTITLTEAHNWLLFFSDKGRVFKLRAYEVPMEENRTAKGVMVKTLLSLGPDESVKAVVPLKTFDGTGFLTMFTKSGMLERNAISEYSNILSSGINAIKLIGDDQLMAVTYSTGGQQYLLSSAAGMSIRFNEDSVRPTGRGAQGVKGMDLSDSYLVSANVIDSADKRQLLTVLNNGYGKRTPLKDFPAKSRGGKGVVATKLGATAKENVSLAAAVVVDDDSTVLLSTSKGLVTRYEASSLSKNGRASRGSKVMNFAKADDSVVDVAVA